MKINRTSLSWIFWLERTPDKVADNEDWKRRIATRWAFGRGEVSEADLTEVEEMERVWECSVALLGKWLEQLEAQEFDGIANMTNWSKGQLSTIMWNLHESDECRKLGLSVSGGTMFVSRNRSFGHVGNLGALTMAYMYMVCIHMLEDKFVWFAVDGHGKRQNSSKRMAGIWWASCGAKYDNDSFGCVVPVQHEAGYQGRKVFRAFPLQRVC